MKLQFLARALLGVLRYKAFLLEEPADASDYKTNL